MFYTVVWDIVGILASIYFGKLKLKESAQLPLPPLRLSLVSLTSFEIPLFLSFFLSLIMDPCRDGMHVGPSVHRLIEKEISNATERLSFSKQTNNNET